MEKKPEDILDFTHYHNSTNRLLKPYTVFCNTHGWEEYPVGWKPLFGIFDEVLRKKRIWAMTQIKQHPFFIGMNNAEAWEKLVTIYAPMVKMFMAGYNYRVMLSVEFEIFKSLLEKLKIRLIVAPGYIFPEEPNAIHDFWKITQKKEALCDYCGQLVLPPNGKFLSPLYFRNKPQRIQSFIYKSGKSIIAERLVLNDWSPNLLCYDCYNDFEAMH